MSTKRKVKSPGRGGARPGAGRPSGPQKIPMSVRVLPETYDAIVRASSLAGVSYGSLLDVWRERIAKQDAANTVAPLLKG